jgi:very-short-patch-repair endonuclease
VLTAAQWQDRGLSPAMVRSLARSGDLIRMRRGVYASRSAVDWAGADPVRAHVLSVLAVRATVGQQSVASHHSAAALHHLAMLQSPPSPPSPPAGIVTLTLPPARPWNRAGPAGIRFHTAELPPEHVTRLYGLPVTTTARTVIDLARTLPFVDGVVIADSALHQEKATGPELRRILDACISWPGVKQARKVVEFADERAESPLESAARVAFDQEGLDAPELQATVQVHDAAARVDFLWREHKVIAEADGLGKYNDRNDLIVQFERDRLLRDAGYKVIHFTWRELFNTPEVVITRIRQALADKGAW